MDLRNWGTSVGRTWRGVPDSMYANAEDLLYFESCTFLGGVSRVLEIGTLASMSGLRSNATTTSTGRVQRCTWSRWPGTVRYCVFEDCTFLDGAELTPSFVTIEGCEFRGLGTGVGIYLGFGSSMNNLIYGTGITDAGIRLVRSGTDFEYMHSGERHLRMRHRCSH